MDATRALKQYKKEMVQAEVASSDPYRLIQMLLDGALTKLSLAKQTLQELASPEVEDKIKKITSKCELISSSISIIACLRSSLNFDAGGDIASNLDRLYDYMNRRLVAANAENNPEIVGEVISLLSEIKSGWDGIADEVAQMTANAQAVKNNNTQGSVSL